MALDEILSYGAREIDLYLSTRKCSRRREKATGGFEGRTRRGRGGSRRAGIRQAAGEVCWAPRKNDP